MADKQTYEVKPSIEVNEDANADQIGNHYANLHQVTNEGGYAKLGYKIKTSYKIDELKGGKKRVRIIVDREPK